MLTDETSIWSNFSQKLLRQRQNSWQLIFKITTIAMNQMKWFQLIIEVNFDIWLVMISEYAKAGLLTTRRG